MRALLVTLFFSLSAETAAMAPPSADPLARAFRTLFRPDSGKRIAFGVLQQEIDEASVPDEAVRAELRASAAADLTNIDAAERDRRQRAGVACSALTAVLAAGLLAGHAPAVARATIFAPAYLSSGFLASAEEGL